MIKTTFISHKNRPVQHGATLDRHHVTSLPFDVNDAIFKDDTSSNIKALCFGPKNDRVLQLIERHLNSNPAVRILYLEDLFKSWSFVCRNGDIHFILSDRTQGNLRIKPTILYCRSALYDDTFPNWKALSAFTHVLNLWQGDILCRPMQHTRNCSKLLQLNATIIPAIKKSNARITIPRSYIVKGEQAFEKIASKHLIVKSLSNLRSDVVDEKEFTQWSRKPLNDLPTLFQEVIAGHDIRVHKLHRVYASKKIMKKTRINYRYDTKSDLIQDYITPEPMKCFCDLVSDIEDNPLLGIDFLEVSENEWVCLEANPGPGWSAYHWDDPNDGRSFLSAFLRVLHND